MSDTVIITGGAGFIGSHLVDLLLEQDFRVVVVDNFSTGSIENIEKHKKNKNFSVYEIDLASTALADIKNKLSREIEECRFMVHLAAFADITRSVTEPSLYYRNNLLATLNTLELARSCPSIKKYVFAASSSCYGDEPELPTTESCQTNPMYPYALTKLLSEETVLHWGKLYKLPVVSLRLFNVFGTRSRNSSSYGAVLGVFMAQKIAGKKMTVVGDGEQTRDFVFVKDVAKAFSYALTSEVKNEVINIGTGHPQSINKLVSLLGGKPTYIPSRPGEPQSTHASISKAKELLGWSPEYSFEEGIAEILESKNLWEAAPVWSGEEIKKVTTDWFKYLGEGG